MGTATTAVVKTQTATYVSTGPSLMQPRLLQPRLRLAPVSTSGGLNP